MKTSIITKYDDAAALNAAAADIKSAASEPETAALFLEAESGNVYVSAKLDGGGNPILTAVSGKTVVVPGQQSLADEVIPDGGIVEVTHAFNISPANIEALKGAGFKYAQITAVILGTIRPTTNFKENADLGYFTYTYRGAGAEGIDVGRSNIGISVGSRVVEQARQITFIADLNDFDAYNKIAYDNQCGTEITLQLYTTKVVAMTGVNI